MANDVLSSDYVGWRLYVFVGVFTPLQVGLVALRFYVRQFTSRTYGWDDWLVSAAILGQLAMAGIAIGERRENVTFEILPTADDSRQC